MYAVQTAKPQIIAVNKTDLGYDEAQLERVAAYAAEKGCRLCRISAEAALGVEELVTAMAETLRTLPPLAVTLRCPDEKTLCTHTVDWNMFYQEEKPE